MELSVLVENNTLIDRYFLQNQRFHFLLIIEIGKFCSM